MQAYRQQAADAGFAMVRSVARPKSAALLLLAGLLGTAAINALFLQTTNHPASLFSMRGADVDSNQLRADERQPGQQAADGRNVTRIVFQNQPTDQSAGEDQQAAVPPVVGLRPQQGPALISAGDGVDPSIAQLQQLLAQLGFYDGAVDGKSGPKTAQAINDYKISAGLQGIELDTEQLITSARNNLMVTAAIPATRPETPRPTRVETVVFSRPGDAASEPAQVSPAQAAQSSFDDAETVRQVQAGLQQFAGDQIVVDGIYGSQTRDAIAEFQSVFRMNVTGRIDAELLEKMRAVGLLEG